MLRILRVFRVFRILRLLKNLTGVRNLITTLVLSLPSLGNVGSLLGLLIFIYAVLGQQLFAFVEHGEGLNESRNFESFGAAALLLLQSLSADGWSDIMDDCMESPLALPYFVSFMMLGFFIFTVNFDCTGP